MNPSLTALALGFSALLTSSGEPLKLLRTPAVEGVPALVDRLPDPKRYKGQLNFENTVGASVVELFRTAVTPAPRVAETFQDDAGIFHRIQQVHPLPATLLCLCSTSS